MSNRDKYTPGQYVNVQIRVKVEDTWNNNVDVSFEDDDGERVEFAVKYDGITTEQTEYLEDNGATYKDPRALVFEGTADQWTGDNAARHALDYAKEMTEEDDKTRTVLVVPGTSIENALSFVNVGIRQVRHTELREEQSRLGL